MAQELRARRGPIWASSPRIGADMPCSGACIHITDACSIVFTDAGLGALLEASMPPMAFAVGVFQETGTVRFPISSHRIYVHLAHGSDVKGDGETHIFVCFKTGPKRVRKRHGERAWGVLVRHPPCEERRSIQDVRERGARTARLPGGTLRPTNTHTLSGCGVSGRRGFPRGLCPVVVVVPPPFLRDWWRGSGRGPQARHVCCVLSTMAPLPPTASSKGKRSEGGPAHIVRGLRGPALECTLPPSRASPPQDSLGLPPQGLVGDCARRGP